MSQELLARLSDHEDRFVERKLEGAGGKEFARAMIAFANSVPEGSTAVLFVGVSNDGRPVGVENPEPLQRTLRTISATKVYPPIPGCNSEVLRIDGKHIVAFTVPFSKDRPHFAGAAYVRVGSESVEATQEMLDEVVASRIDKVRWILRDRAEVWTVVVLGGYLGDHVYVGANHQDVHECKIIECNAHFVRLRDIGSGRLSMEPLPGVTVGRDEQQHRPKLIVYRKAAV